MYLYLGVIHYHKKQAEHDVFFSLYKKVCMVKYESLSILIYYWVHVQSISVITVSLCSISHCAILVILKIVIARISSAMY